MKGVLPVVCLVASIFLFYWYIDPTYVEVKNLRTEEATLNQALTRALELQQTRDQLLSRFNTFSQDDLAHLEKLLPDHVDNVRLALDMDSMASLYGMRVRSLAIQNTNDKNKAKQSATVGPDEHLFESTVLSFTVNGRYDTVRQYMLDLEKSLRLVDIEGITFNSTESGQYDVTIALRTYWLKP